ncbi:hypothetical protein P280DRAFT_467225 [Massarina eburnea CBS 473.64]|uniref:Uncharacterized protein n=1 Tax=Massarina eburnea CBS 473.64 TaxID=1395130 RepID=A0A6A6S8T6_9PLEO|nr:hypothetical protein P280DRAFT_467225 [Massarina eburnea CBS 473.64]
MLDICLKFRSACPLSLAALSSANYATKFFRQYPGNAITVVVCIVIISLHIPTGSPVLRGEPELTRLSMVL